MRTSKEIMKIVEDKRSQLGMSQSELSRRTGISTSALSRYIKGDRNFPLNKVDDFANALDISSEYLLDVYMPVNDNGNDSNIQIVNILNKLSPNNQSDVLEYAKFKLSQQSK